MIVKSTLWRWDGDRVSWHFITISAEESAEVRAHSLINRGGFGSVRVEASVNDVTWRTSVFPQRSGGYLLPVKAEVRRKADIGLDDAVTVELVLL